MALSANWQDREKAAFEENAVDQGTDKRVSIKNSQSNPVPITDLPRLKVALKFEKNIAGLSTDSIGSYTVPANQSIWIDYIEYTAPNRSTITSKVGAVDMIKKYAYYGEFSGLMHFAGMKFNAGDVISVEAISAVNKSGVYSFTIIGTVE